MRDDFHVITKRDRHDGWHYEVWLHGRLIAHGWTAGWRRDARDEANEAITRYLRQHEMQV